MIINKLVKKKLHLQICSRLTNCTGLLHTIKQPVMTHSLCSPSEVATSRSEHLLAKFIESLYQERCFGNEGCCCYKIGAASS